MKIINKITISKFRSLGDNTQVECSDVNIFSGGNDSGKSNVIKAINLFFNDRTDNHIRYNPDNDFNKWFRDNNERGQRNIVIKTQFNPGRYSDPQGINKGFIAEKIYGIDSSITSKYFSIDNSVEFARDSVSYRRADAVVRGLVKYMYVPAIRGGDFRQYIQRELLQITNSANNDLAAIFDSLKIELDKTFSEFGKHLQNIINVNVLSDVNFSTLLESMSFNTNEQIKIRKRGRGAIEEEQNIPMLNRGDGIQMQFLSFLLWFIASKDKKHLYIWGFEEPEVAYEFKKQFDMADVFIKDFSKNAQIFLSTHSPAFVFLHGADNIRQYRVYKEKDKIKNRVVSNISDIDKYVENLFESDNRQSKQLQQDIWGTNYQRMTNAIGHILKETDDYKQIEAQLQNIVAEVQMSKKKTEAKERELNTIKDELKDLYPEKIFICEDVKGITIWTKLFEKINLKGIKILSSKGCSNDSIESAIKFKQSERNGYDPKIFRQLDLDGYLPEQSQFLEREMPLRFKQFTKYVVKFLPVNELENFALMADPDFTEAFVKSDFDKFYSITNEFMNTARANLSKVRSRYTYDSDRETQKKFNQQEEAMRINAGCNIISLFPGKNICKLKNRFSAERKLKSLSKEDFPESLADFLTTIKVFFETE